VRNILEGIEMKKPVTLYIVVGMVLGVLVGYLCHIDHSGCHRCEDGRRLFLVITGHFPAADQDDHRAARLRHAGVRTRWNGWNERRAPHGDSLYRWFVCASLMSLALGLFLANLLQPGAGLHMVQTNSDVATGLNTAGLNFKDFVTHAFPTSIARRDGPQ